MATTEESNATTAQRSPRRGRRGQVETIAERWLTFEELRELGEQSERLFAAARALVEARSSRTSLPVSSTSAGALYDVRAGHPTRLIEPPASAGAEWPTLYGVEPAQGGDSSDGSAETPAVVDVDDDD